MDIKICEVIRKKRREMNISQEILAEKLGITVQAVSKWENSLSCPDLSLLPQIADFFGITMDNLFFDREENGASAASASPELAELPDDNKLRVVQCVGKKVLSQEEYDFNKKIKLILPKPNKISDNVNLHIELNGKEILNNFKKNKVDIEVWGSADIDGDISGDLKAGGAVNCGDVGNNVTTVGDINCGDVGNNATTADGGINCGDVGNNATTAGGSISCGDVGCNATAGGNIKCECVGGNAIADGDIECESIGGDAKAGKNIVM